MLKQRLKYWKRIGSAYLTTRTSHVTFWHEDPAVNLNVNYQEIGEYYQVFEQKAHYSQYFDDQGVILLDYHGSIGKQYYPIAIAQYGLACFNQYKRTGNLAWFAKAVSQGQWLVSHLRANEKGAHLWYADFDWEYRELLKAPWPSALAQGNGISLLVRLYQETGHKSYYEAVVKAYQGLMAQEGGLTHLDSQGDLWFEEVVVNPPTHILNGFMWTMMGVYDYYLLTKDEEVKNVFQKSLQTLTKNLHRFDVGFWSLYELSGTKMKMIASLFYHRLHIIQLNILFRMTNEAIFEEYAYRWMSYERNILYRTISQSYKAIFKLIHY